MNSITNNSTLSLLKNKAFVSVLLISMGVGYSMVINLAVSPYVAKSFGLSEKELASMFAWTSLGAFGTIFLTRWVDKLGRRRLTIICYNMSLVFCVTTALSPSLLAYILSQFFFVAFAGVALTTVTVMTGEYLPAKQRAKGMTLQVLLNSIGHGGPMLFIVFLAGIEDNWRWMWLSIPILSLPFVFFVIKSLDEPEVFEKDKEKKIEWKKLFSEKYKKRTLLMASSYSLATISRAAPMYYMMYFFVTILEMEQWVASFIIVGGGLVGLVGTFIGGWTCDRYGRRFCINLFNILGASSIVFLYILPDYIDSKLWLTLSLAFVFSASWIFETSLTVGIKTISTELYPTQLRATFGGIMVFLLKISTIICNFAVAALLIWLDDLVLAIIIVCSLRFAAFFGFHALPETKGQDLTKV